ncbi:bacterophage-related protein [Lasius niger]|uniref:Bacterophage-related protein n=1 Tax=Lasius niger TaxID=67767 RepID=A0A0J7K8P5_LASNI|nr:bacterophage-related protein [Lasius niger]
MWSREWHKVPFYSVVGERVFKPGIVCQGAETSLELAISPAKVRAVVTIHVGRETASSNKTGKGGEKAFGRVIIYTFEMNCFDSETYEYGNVVFGRFMTTTDKRNNIHRTGIIHSSM